MNYTFVGHLGLISFGHPGGRRIALGLFAGFTVKNQRSDKYSKPPYLSA